MGRRGYIYVILAACLWGILPVIGRGLNTSGVDPLTVAAQRATLSAFLFCFSSLLFKREALRIQWRDIPFFVLYALFCVVGMYCFYFLAIDTIPVAMASILLYTAPSFVVIFSSILLKEPMTKEKLLSLGITFVGCMLVVRVYDLSSIRLSYAGILFGLGSGISYAMLSILGKIGLHRYTPWTNMTYTLLFGTLFMWLIRPPWVLYATPYTLSQWSGFWALALFCTLLPNTLYVTGLQHIEAGQASITATLEPVVATLSAALLFQEVLDWPQLIGMGLVLAAVSLPMVRRYGRVTHSDTGVVDPSS